MKKRIRTIVLTGTHGMVAPALIRILNTKEYNCVAWNRDDHDPSNSEEVLSVLNEIRPLAVFHLAYGPFSWSKDMALYCLQNDIKFVYISTVNVYGDRKGPHYVDSDIIPNDDYSRYKSESEKVVLETNPNSYIIRIGWQIGPLDEKHDNSMLQYILRNMKERGYVEADDTHLLSASFVEDCAESIVDIFQNLEPSLYLVNGNFDMSFYDVCVYLENLYPELGIVVKRVSNMNKNEIMIDERTRCKIIKDKRR